MRIPQALLVVCVATAGVWLLPTTAEALPSLPSVTCGMAVTTSIRLTHDLNCPTTALFVERDAATPGALTIDLGGHTVSSAVGPTIDARDGSTTMTLERGRVSTGDGSFSVIDDGAGNIYERLTFDGGGISSNSDGSPHISRNQFIHGAAVFSDENTIDIEHNTFSGSGSAPTSFAETNGAVWLLSTFSTVIDNTISGYGTGITVVGDLASADIQRNVVSRNGIGMRIIGPGSPSTPLMAVTVHNNLVFSNRGDGVIVGDGTNSVVTGNGLLANGGDGLHIDASPAFGGPAFGLTATLSRNVSVLNGQWGIEAPVATAQVTVTDGGHNFVRANGSGDCLNFTCH